MFVTKVEFPSVIMYITGYEASNFFNMVTATRFQFFVCLRAVFTQEVIAMRALKINRLSFITASAVWQVSLPISAVGLNNLNHLLLNRSDGRLLTFLSGHSVSLRHVGQLNFPLACGWRPSSRHDLQKV